MGGSNAKILIYTYIKDIKYNKLKITNIYTYHTNTSFIPVENLIQATWTVYFV